MKGATRHAQGDPERDDVSIHAPNEGSDPKLEGDDLTKMRVSIHAPNEGSDAVSPLTGYIGERFQSTLPMKGATRLPEVVIDDLNVSIHAPNEGSDIVAMKWTSLSNCFNPRSQ